MGIGFAKWWHVCIHICDSQASNKRVSELFDVSGMWRAYIGMRCVACTNYTGSSILGSCAAGSVADKSDGQITRAGMKPFKGLRSSINPLKNRCSFSSWRSHSWLATPCTHRSIVAPLTAVPSIDHLPAHVDNADFSQFSTLISALPEDLCNNGHALCKPHYDGPWQGSHLLPFRLLQD